MPKCLMISGRKYSTSSGNKTEFISVKNPLAADLLKPSFGYGAVRNGGSSPLNKDAGTPFIADFGAGGAILGENVRFFL